MSRSSDELIPTRTTLLQRLKDWEDQPSWQEFFDTYWKLIYSVALKSGLTETEAQDVVQETMISVAKQMPDFKYNRKIGSFKSWLLNLTRWRITDQFRKRGALSRFPSREPDDTQTYVEKMADENSPDLGTLWDAEWEKNILEAALGNVKRRLDPEKYQIFDFYVNKDWPPEKVAARFGISVSQVYLAKHRVTELLRDEVNRLETKMS